MQLKSIGLTPKEVIDFVKSKEEEIVDQIKSNLQEIEKIRETEFQEVVLKLKNYNVRPNSNVNIV